MQFLNQLKNFSSLLGDKEESYLDLLNQTGNYLNQSSLLDKVEDLEYEIETIKEDLEKEKKRKESLEENVLELELKIVDLNKERKKL